MTRKAARKIASLGVVALGLMLTLSAHADVKRYLVQFKSTAGYQSLSQNLQSFQMTENYGGVSLASHSATSVKTLPRLQMLVVQTSDLQMINDLKAQGQVERVEEEIIHPAPPQVATWAQTTAFSQQFTNKKIDMPWGIKAVKAPQAWSVTRGQGARVMILDTGLDVSHPALRGRVEKGRNFVPGESSNDFSDTIGHGTHVAGTILADGGGDGLLGVAPAARVLSAKICAREGCSSTAMASALEWAVEERVDVVNMSLGGAELSAGEAQALAAAEENGVFIAAASGNDGVNRVSFPAALDTVLAVGAVDSKMVKAEFSQWGPELDIVAPGVEVYSSVPRGSGRTGVAKLAVNGRLTEVNSKLFAGSPMHSEINAALVDVGLGKDEEFRAADVSGKIALISRGEIPFREKVANATKYGAVAVLIYNNAPGLASGTIAGEDGSEAGLPAAMIEQSVGQNAKSALASGRALNGSLSVDPTDYAVLEGTSMATPHVTGVAALIRAANKSLTPAQVREIIKATATPLGPNDQNQYGAGMINADAAVRRATSTGGLDFRQVAN